MMHLNVADSQYNNKHMQAVEDMLKLVFLFSMQLNELTSDDVIELDVLRHKLYLMNSQLRTNTMIILKDVWTTTLDDIVTGKYCEDDYNGEA